MEVLYKRIEIQSRHLFNKDEWIMIVKGRQRRSPYDDCYLLQHGYSFTLNGKEIKIDGYEHNSGFDCNYRKEWKTYKGVLRYIENNIGLMPKEQEPERSVATKLLNEQEDDKQK